MKLTEALSLWSEIPNFEDYESFDLQTFLKAVEESVGLDNDIPLLGGYEDES